MSMCPRVLFDTFQAFVVQGGVAEFYGADCGETTWTSLAAHAHRGDYHLSLTETLSCDEVRFRISDGFGMFVFIRRSYVGGGIDCYQYRLQSVSIRSCDMWRPLAYITCRR